MAAEKGNCPEERFNRGIGNHVRLKVYDLLSHYRDPTVLSVF